MYKVLLLDDSEESKDLVVIALGSSFDVSWAGNIDTASARLAAKDFDLLLLDVDLPDGDGFRFYSVILNDPKTKNVPVIFLTGNDSVSGKILGFSLGADDYIVKPFNSAELKARVEMRLKKYQALRRPMEVLRRGELEIHLTAQRAFALGGGKKVDLLLTPMELKLLILLSSHDEQVFSRNQLLDSAWGTDSYQTDRTIDTHVYALRKKLGELGHYIQAVYGEGYRFSVASAPAPKQNRRSKHTKSA